MKRMFFSMALIGGLLFLGAGEILATEADQSQDPVTRTVRPGFTDADGDGICDYYDGTRPGKGLGPGNGQGLGKSTGKGLGQGLRLRDGSCGGERKLDGSGQGRGNGRRLRDGSGGNCPVPAK